MAVLSSRSSSIVYGLVWAFLNAILNEHTFLTHRSGLQVDVSVLGSEPVEAAARDAGAGEEPLLKPVLRFSDAQAPQEER